MAWLTIILGIVLGFVIAGLKEYSEKKPYRPQKTTRLHGTVPTVPQHTRYDILEYYKERRHLHTRRKLELPRLGELSRRQKTTIDKGKSLIENWRKSIVGLVKLADRNLSTARQNLGVGNYRAAVQAASTSTENVARALIHCFGDKPDTESGQEEALRFLSRKFKGNEKTEFERTIDIVAQLSQNKTVLRRLSSHDMPNGLFDEARTRQIVESASKIVTCFKQIMTERFANEIPELSEACPKCHSFNIYVWTFGSQMTRYECANCHSKWIGPRT